MSLSSPALAAALLVLAPTAQDVSAEDAEAFLAFAAEVERTIAEGDPSTYHDAFDADALMRRVREEVGTTGMMLNSLLRRSKAGFVSTNTWAADIVESNEDYDGSYTFLRSMPGAPDRLLFRWIGDDGLDYHELRVVRDDTDTVRIVDLRSWSGCEWLSESASESILDALAFVDRSRWEKTTGGGEELVEGISRLGSMRKVLESDPEAALEIYDELPAALQARLSVQQLRITAATDLDDETYLEVVRDFARRFPESTVVPLMMIDVHTMLEDHEAALASIDELDVSVHGDSYLDISRAQVRIEMRAFEDAEADLARAVERDERLETAAVWEHLDIALLRDDHEQTFRRLRWLWDHSDWYVGDTSEIERYEAFNRSEPGKRWIETIREEEGDDDDGPGTR